MNYRRRIGEFNKRLGLLKPSAPEADKMGGRKDRTYEFAGIVFAQKRDKSTTVKQVIGAYVTEKTCYFVIRDCRSLYPITKDWHIDYEGHKYVINSVTVLDDNKPYFLELECTWIGG